jgi:Putative peptidoglycan binding domain
LKNFKSSKDFFGDNAMKLAIAALATLTIASSIPAALSAQQMPDINSPANAKPGQCYARVLVPASYVADQTLSVPIEDTYSMPKVAQAQLSAPVNRDVIAADAYKMYEVTKPKFAYIDEKITITPQYHKIEVIPPASRQINKTYTIRKPTLVWRRGSDLSSVKRINNATGETYCLVEEYGESVNVPYTTYSAPKAEVRFVTVPEQSIVNRRQIVEKEASVREVYVPALMNSKYPNVKTQTLISDAQVIGEETKAARTTTIQTQKLQAQEYYTWVQVPCDTQGAVGVPVYFNNSNQGAIIPPKFESKKTTSQVTIIDVQKRLQSLGYYKGPLDGIYGSKTKSAMATFQTKAGLKVDGKPNVESLKALDF